MTNWESIPETIPLHYNYLGEPDNWGNKVNLLYLAIFIPIGSYVLLLLAEFIDPKKKISSMEGKFYSIRVVFSVIMSGIILIIAYANVNKLVSIDHYIYILLGILFVFLGNYFNNLKPNYFIGFRTPWTLENETVWRRTHQKCSIVWLIGGLIIIAVNIIPVLIPIALPINVGILLIIVAIPIIYSYMEYRKVVQG